MIRRDNMPTKEDFNKELYDKFLLGTVAINPQNRKEWDSFLTILDKETKMTWSDGERPAAALNWELGASNDDCCGVDKVYKYYWLNLCWKDYYKQHGYKVIKYTDLLKK